MFYLLLRYILVGVEGNLVYFKSQDPNFDILKYLENFYNFYFSLGTGLFFTSIIPLLLIFLGKNKNTVFKLIAIFFLSFVLSFFEGFHGCAPGIRYFLPFLIIFFPEYKAGIEKIFQKKFFLLFIALIAILNIPTLEYRNFHITEYINGTVYSNKSFGVGKIKNNELDLFKWPINSLKFNNVIFSNIVLFHKILGSKDFKVNEFKIKVENIYPQTGLGRIIFIGKNNINLKYKFIERISAKYNKIFFFLYYSFLLSFLIYFFYLIKILYKKY